jgi:hypothetical protein
MKAAAPVLTIVACLVGLSVTSCRDAADLYSFAEWRDVLKGNGNWLVVKIPDSKLVPGSIVKITKDEGLSWIDSLHSCGIPAELLAGASISDPKALVVRGASPAINFKKSKEFSADAVLNVAGVKAGAEFNKMGKIALSIGENGGDALRLIRLKDWIQANADKFSRSCLDELAKPDRYIVSESFRFSSATYSFFDKGGAKVKLTVPQLQKILKLEPSVKFEITGEGSLRIDEPMYVAVRRAVSAAGDFKTLGEPTPTSASGDAILEAYNSSQH